MIQTARIQTPAARGVNLLSMTLHQYRRLYEFTALYMVLLVGAGLIVEHPVNALVTTIFAIPFAVVMIHSLVAFVNPDADLTAPGSHYPPYLLRLPVQTRVLALWPMAAGSIWAVLTWATFTGLFLGRRGVHVEFMTPAIGFVALVLSMQALMWSPFRFGALRLVLMLVIPLSLVNLGVWMSGFGWSPVQLSRCYAIIALVAGGLAWNGVARARTTPIGVGSLRFRERPTKTLLRSRPATRRSPFSSPLAAQVWMEWKLQGRLLPIITVVVLVFASIPLLLDGSLLTPLNGYGSIRPWVYTMLGVVPFIPVVLATCVGMGARKSNMRGGDGAYHLFYATRPLDSKNVIRAKTLAFTLGTAASWAITLGVVIGWLLLPAKGRDGVTTTGLTVLIGGMDSQQWEVISVTLISLIALTWRNQFVGAFVDYVPKRWIAVGYPLLVVMAGAVLCSLSRDAFTGSQSTNGGFSHQNGFAWWVFWVLSFALVIKMGAAWAIGRSIIRIRPRDTARIVWSAVTWLGVTLIAGGALIWMENLRNPISIFALTDSILVPMLFGALAVPIVRPLYATYSLEIGRHR